MSANAPYGQVNSNQAPPQKSSGRWFLFGCLGCGGLLLVCGGVVAAFSYWAYNLGMNNEGVKAAKALCENSAEVQEAIGAPVTIAFPTEVNQNNNAIQYRFPISGPKGSGTLDIDVSVQNGSNFVLDRATATTSDGKKIELK